MVLTKRIRDAPHHDIDKVIWVRMGDLNKLDEDCWKTKENNNHIQQLWGEQWNDKGKMKSFDEGKLVL
jgi:hypothetical protein